MECGNLRTSHQWLKRKKHSTSKLGAECFIFLCCIFWFVLHWKAECCISWFCVANIFSICCNQWTECCKEKIECCNQKKGVAFVSFCESFATSDLQEWLRQAVFEGFSFSTNGLYPVTSNKYLTNWCLHLTLSRYYPTFLQSPFWKFCRCGRKILASCCYCYAPTNQLPAPLWIHRSVDLKLHCVANREVGFVVGRCSL